MKFSKEDADPQQGETVRRTENPRIVYRQNGVDRIASELYSVATVQNGSGFPHWNELPERCKDAWRDVARGQLDHFARSLEVDDPPRQTVAPNATVVTKDQQQQLRDEIDSISGRGQLGRKCTKCGAAMVHYRLKGYVCSNPACPGPYGGGHQ